MSFALHRSLYMERDARGILLGKTGTGKSTLARCLLDGFYRQTGGRQQVIIDSKADFRLPDRVAYDKGLVLAYTPEEAVEAINAGNHLLYRPLPDYTTVNDYDQVYRAVFWRGDLECYTDELRLTCVDGSKYSPYQGAVYQQGRSRLIRAVGGTQRPSGVPVVTISETEHTWIFLLRWEDDLDRVRKMIGEKDWPSQHCYWFLGPEDRSPTCYELRFESPVRLAA